MAGIQRFVTYIYAYENGQKTGNAGYAKIETRGERGEIDIHFLNGGIYRGKGTVAFLYAQSGKLIYLPIGGFVIENGAGSGSFAFQTSILAGVDFGFSKIDGIYIIDSENRKYLSFWRDVDVTDFGEGNFAEYSPDVPLQKEVIEDAEQESLHTMEIPMRNVFPTYTLEDIWKNLERTKPLVQINDQLSAIQMELSDLRELPKRYWYLGNNSFLLHGFFNYHHLLFGRLPNGKWFLGVPGAYDPQERVMASIFGFPGFLQEGIWYHILED